MHLNGWQRLGAVLTIIWMAIISIIGALDYFPEKPKANIFIHYVDRDMTSVSAEEKRKSDAATKIFGIAEQEAKFHINPFAATLAIPIIGCWLMVYLLIFAIRWVAVGFK